jgi:hypothetical protein
MSKWKCMLQTREDVDSAWRTDTDFARESMLLGGSLATTFTIYSHDGPIIPIVSAIQNDHQRAMFMRVVRAACIAWDAAALAAFGEVWLLADPQTPNLRPSQSERRQECVFNMMIARLDSGEIKRLMFRNILRDAKAKVVGLEELKFPGMDDAGFSGALYDLMPTTRPTAEERLRAQEEMNTLIEQARREESRLH